MWPDRTLGRRSSSRSVNVIELEDEVQEFEPSQDTGTRQILSVQVDVSDVRFFAVPPRVLCLP